MPQAEEIRFKEFRERFATEDACRAELLRLRFAEGFVCPSAAVGSSTPSRGGTPTSAAPAAIRPPSPPERSCTAPICL